MPKSEVGWESYSVPLKLFEPAGVTKWYWATATAAACIKVTAFVEFCKQCYIGRPACSEECVRVRNLILVLFALVALTVVANSQDRATGGIRGKVKVETGTPAGVSVVVRSGDREITRVATDKSGSFIVQSLRPGMYGLTFRKPGLSVGTIENVEVKPGKTRSLGDRLVLTIDEGSIAFIRGSVFSLSGRSVPGARVELARILDDGTTKKIDGRITTETGSFVFRLTPELAKYRVSVKIDGAEPASSDVEIDGAAVYRIAISLVATPKSDE